MSSLLHPSPAPSRTPRLGTTPFLGFHYDIARGAYLRPESLRDMMRQARDAGFNHFLPYLENMVRLEPIAKACPSCAYTPGQWRGFEDWADELGLELVPHFNVIGHTQDICRAYPHLAAGPGQKEMDPTQPTVTRWLSECLDAWCDASRAKMFLIGGDEWQAPAHLLRDPAIDPGRVWVDQLNRAINLLAARGRTPIVWHDVLMHYPHVIPLLSRQAVVAFWFYDADSDLPVLSLLKRHGFRTIMAAGNLGTWSRRWFAGLQTAARAYTDHKADGFMITHWELARYERVASSMNVLRRWLAGAEPAPAVLDAISLAEAIDKTPASLPFVENWRQRELAQLEAPAWSNMPEARDHFRAHVRGDRQTLADSFLTHHFPEGPTHAQLQAAEPSPAFTPPTPPPAPASTPDLQLHVEEHAELGAILRVHDRRQTLVIYPKFGATLQDWWVDGRQLIGHPLHDNPAARHVPPGGYRSYNGGLRPIWALGAHHNPNALWQGPFDFAIVEQSPQAVVLRLTRAMPHVTFTNLVTIHAGDAGFTMDLSAVNHLEHAWCGFNFNLALQLTPGDLAAGTFRWKDGDKDRQTSVPQRGDSAFWIAGPSELLWQCPDWDLLIQTDPRHTAGFYVDWQPTLITPDARARYQPMSVGQTLRTQWRFAVTTR